MTGNTLPAEKLLPPEEATRSSLVVRQPPPWWAWVRALLLVVVLAGMALALVGLLVVLQGRYADLRHADAIVLISSACGNASTAASGCASSATLDHAFDLYRRGLADTVLLASDDAAAGRAYLLELGLPEASLLPDAQGESRWLRVSRAADIAREGGIGAVLLVGRPSDMLLGLKMSRDLDLIVYSAPLPTAGREIPPIGSLLAEALAYWRYVLLGQ